MSDEATVTASLHIVKLVDRARDLDPEAVEELAARVEVAVAAPDRSVAVAFGLRRRGGEQPQRTAARRGRDRAIKALAPGGDLPLEQQARLVSQKLARYRPDPRDAQSQSERRWLWEARQSGLPDPGKRQIRRILGDDDF